MLGVCYYPEHIPESWWQEDARRMRAVGISFVRIGEFAWSRIEPRRDAFDFGWLDRAMDVLGAEGLGIVLGTPTATPPKWLMDERPEITPVDAWGRVRGFGSRRHYTFSSAAWWEESDRIVKTVAARYGEHPALVGWQTDNEYGCHDTVLSWGQEDLKGFRAWLRRHYQTCDQLNEAWGNAFWSMEVGSFDQVSLPNLTVTEANPAARMDFWRFHSEQVAAYDKMQCDIIRAHSPGRWITHNFMGFSNDFDHWKIRENLDFASWDSYPIGFVEVFFPFSEDERTRWAETSHPDIAPFHHDLYRGVGRGRFWVMEQQPGPVNWAPWNPVPKPGMVRLWTWEAFAHGAEVVSYFPWRQAPFGQEQNHAGLNLPGSHEPSAGGQEVEVVSRELAALESLASTSRAEVALVYDYEASWLTRIQPQGADFRYHELAFRWYEAVRRLGLDVDMLAPGEALDGYRLILVPSLPIVSDAADQAFRSATGLIVYGPRTGSRTRFLSIPCDAQSGLPAGIAGVRVRAVSSLRPNLRDAVSGAVQGHAVRWREHILADGDILARFENEDPAFVAKDNHHYVACWPDAELLTNLMRLVADRAGLEAIDLPEHVRMRKRGAHTFAFNYGGPDWRCPREESLLLGSAVLGPQQVSMWAN